MREDELLEVFEDLETLVSLIMTGENERDLERRGLNGDTERE